jgi:hypothetical protein
VEKLGLPKQNYPLPLNVEKNGSIKRNPVPKTPSQASRSVSLPNVTLPYVEQVIRFGGTLLGLDRDKEESRDVQKHQMGKISHERRVQTALPDGDHSPRSLEPK